MSLQDTYEWAKKQREAWDNLRKSDDTVAAYDKEISHGGDHPVKPAEVILLAEFDTYKGEVCKNGPDLIFHFWPPEGRKRFEARFKDKLAEVFPVVFKYQEIQWDRVEDLNSWAVKVVRGVNAYSQDLSAKLFTKLDESLK